MLFNRTIHSFKDARRIAKQRLPWMVFDYIDGAAGSGYSEQLNRETLQKLWLKQQILKNVQKRNIAVPLFTTRPKLPFGIAPMGMCNLSSPKADRLLASLSAQFEIPIGVSTVASTSLEKMNELSNGNAWFQLYLSGRMEGSYRLVNRAKEAGYDTLIVTVDVPEVGRRPRELKHGFKMPFQIGARQLIDFACHPQWSISQILLGKPKMANFGGEHGVFDRTESRAAATWDTLAKIRDNWTGNLVVKGVVGVEDSKRLQSIGVDAIQVSSHGGRQLNSSKPAILALRDIREALGPDMKLFYDSGIRNGEDIIKAYAMGANFVFLGRPFSFAVAANGAVGLQEITNLLAEEVSITLAQLGLNDINDVTYDALVKNSVV